MGRVGEQHTAERPEGAPTKAWTSRPDTPTAAEVPLKDTPTEVDDDAQSDASRESWPDATRVSSITRNGALVERSTRGAITRAWAGAAALRL